MTTNGTGMRQRWLVRCSDSLELLLQCTDQGKVSRNDFSIRIFARYGYTPTTIWMDNLYCYGTEDRLDVRPPSQFQMQSTEMYISYMALQECRFDGWGKNDCERVEAAGVKCQPHPPSTTTSTTTTAMPKLPMASVGKDMDIRLVGGRTSSEGRVEMRYVPQ